MGHNFRVMVLSDAGQLVNSVYSVIPTAAEGDSTTKIEALMMAAKIINDEIVAQTRAKLG